MIIIVIVIGVVIGENQKEKILGFILLNLTKW